MCSSHSVNFKTWRAYVQLRLLSCALFLFYLFAKPETNCSPRLLHFGVCFFVTNSYHFILLSALSLSTLLWLSPLKFFFPLISFVVTKLDGVLSSLRHALLFLRSRLINVWLEGGILLHMCLPNRSQATLNDHLIVVKGFPSVTINMISVSFAAKYWFGIRVQRRMKQIINYQLIKEVGDHPSML